MVRMALTVQKIQDTSSDAELLRLLQEELNIFFPLDSRRDIPVFLSKMQTAPRGLRAMAATFELDVSMTLDDLAWHFVNHHNLDLYEVTLHSLRELEAIEAAKLFKKAFLIIEPHWNEFLPISQNEDVSPNVHAWLDRTGIQKLIDPINKDMWKLLNQWPLEGLMHYWVLYARKYPERCIVITK